MCAKPAEIFRRNVRRILDQRDMSMEELALLSKTKRPNISRILSGSEQVTLERAGRIAKALKLDLSDLLSSKQKIFQEIA